VKITDPAALNELANVTIQIIGPGNGAREALTKAIHLLPRSMAGDEASSADRLLLLLAALGYIVKPIQEH
jgi:hypothetical protein